MLSTASSSIGVLIGSLPRESFYSSYWGKEYLLIRHARDHFSSLFSWEALSEVLSTHRFEFPRLRLLAGGKVAPPTQYMVERTDRRGNRFVTHSTQAVSRMMASGASLHITSINETWTPLAQFAAALESEVRGRVQVNVHAGYVATRGFHTHWDGHDVYAAQIQGSKRWRLFGFSEQAPYPVAPDEKRGAPSNESWEGVLGQGDMLYMPRGYWHATEGTNEPSLHLTFAVQHSTGLDFVQSLLELLKDDVTMRRDVSDDVFVSTVARDTYLSDIKAALLARMNGDSLQMYLDRYRASLGHSNQIRLVPTMEDDRATEP